MNLVIFLQSNVVADMPSAQALLDSIGFRFLAARPYPRVPKVVDVPETGLLPLEGSYRMTGDGGVFRVKRTGKALTMEAEGPAAFTVLHSVQALDPGRREELGRRLDDPDYNQKGTPVQSPEEAFQSMQDKLKGKKKEHFYILCLDTRNRVSGKKQVSQGNLDSSIVHPREVFKDAISALAASVIFVHNHPSGDLEPSSEDVNLTKRLVEAGELLGIPVLDHIIVSDRGYTSMKSRNLI